MKKLFQKILAYLAQRIVKKYRPDIIAITGSVGKTSAKDAICAVLSAHFSVRGSEKNYNNEIGVPLTIIGAHAQGKSIFGWVKVLTRALSLCIHHDVSYPSILVLEMGADKPGDIEYLVSLAPPKIGVITAIGSAHLELLGSTENIAREKKKIFSRHTTSDQWMVLNADDPPLFPLSEKTPAHVMTFGQHPDASVRISDIQERYEFHALGSSVTGIACIINYQDQSIRTDFSLLVGRHVLQSFLSSIAVGCIYGVPLQKSIDCLRGCPSPKGRMRLIPGIKETLIIDDTYNSSGSAARGALDVLEAFRIDESARRIAVLGDMLELGSHTEREHRDVGAYVARKNIDYLIAVGPAARWIADGALEQSTIDDAHILMFTTAVEAGTFLQKIISKGDVILIKGSQGVRLERIVKEIMANPLRAEDLLVRQGTEWQ